MSSAIDLLELRLKYIEERLFGAKEANNGFVDSINLFEQLLQIDSKLKELTTGKERFNNCFQKLSQLDKWLDNEYMDRMVASDSSKYEEVLAFEEQIKAEAKTVDKMNELVANIDSPHIRNYDKFEPKLNEIRFIALKQSQDSVQIEEKTKLLLLAYNQWLSVIKSQLANWDSKLTQLQLENASKKASKRS